MEERDNMLDLAVDGMILLKWMLVISLIGVDWLCLVQYWKYW